MLVFVMGCAFGLSLVAGIVLVALGSDTRGAGIVAFVGTVASGAAMAWIVRQRNDASIQKEKALKLVDEYCREPERTIERLEAGADPAQIVVPAES
jgi:NAD(P)H-hydrate repair Nnr-like enzyme with NAD(P)H-hydrate dehydratase domain